MPRVTAADFRNGIATVHVDRRGTLKKDVPRILVTLVGVRVALPRSLAGY
jgi:hypothetical protein